MTERSDGEIAEIIKKRRRIKIYESRRTTFRWIFIILVVSIITIVLLNVVPPLFSKIDIVDTTYRPRDVERQYWQIQKMREFGDDGEKRAKGNWQETRGGQYKEITK